MTPELSVCPDRNPRRTAGRQGQATQSPGLNGMDDDVCCSKNGSSPCLESANSYQKRCVFQPFARTRTSSNAYSGQYSHQFQRNAGYLPIWTGGNSFRKKVKKIHGNNGEHRRSALQRNPTATNARFRLSQIQDFVDRPADLHGDRQGARRRRSHRCH